MSHKTVPLFCLLLLVTACGGILGDRTASGEAGGQSKGKGRTASGLVEGKDYVVLERFRILDEMGFDRPVEAMSVLVPRGWRTQGGVRWRGINECRVRLSPGRCNRHLPTGRSMSRYFP